MSTCENITSNNPSTSEAIHSVSRLNGVSLAFSQVCKRTEWCSINFRTSKDGR